MTPENFVYWLQGVFELTTTKQLSETQTQIIKDHLQLVFNKVTPDVSLDDIEDEPDLTKAQELLVELQESINKKYAPLQPYTPFNPFDGDGTGNPPPTLPSSICSDGGDMIDTTLFCSKVEPTVTEDWYDRTYDKLENIND